MGWVYLGWVGLGLNYTLSWVLPWVWCNIGGGFALGWVLPWELYLELGFTLGGFNLGVGLLWVGFYLGVRFYLGLSFPWVEFCLGLGFTLG